MYDHVRQYRRYPAEAVIQCNKKTEKGEKSLTPIWGGKQSSLLTESAENENLCEKEGDRKIATEEVWRLSNVLGSLRSREHLEGLSVRAHTCERTLVGSVWHCWYALRESHWETDVPHSIPQVGSTHMHACTYAHLQTCKQKIYSYVHKQRGLATFCQTDGPKISAYFSRHKHLHFSVYFSVSEAMSASWTLLWSCSPCKYTIYIYIYNSTLLQKYWCTQEKHSTQRAECTEHTHMQTCPGANTQQTDGHTPIQISQMDSDIICQVVI